MFASQRSWAGSARRDLFTFGVTPKNSFEVYNAEAEEFDKVMSRLFAEGDERGITEEQFIQGLKKLPELEEALMKDLDPEFGRLRSYRTLEDQLAKLMGNLERLRRELLTNPTEEREAEIKTEIRSRKDQCKKLRAKGVIPSVGPVVFNQMDLDKDRFVSEREASRCFKALKHVHAFFDACGNLLWSRFGVTYRCKRARIALLSKTCRP